LKQYVFSGGNIFLAALEFSLGSIRYTHKFPGSLQRMSDNGNAMEYFRSVKHDPSYTDKKGGATDRALTPDLDQHNLDSWIGTSFRIEHILEAGEKKPVQVVKAESWVFKGMTCFFMFLSHRYWYCKWRHVDTSARRIAWRSSRYGK
jgi:hypothetical protein